jgi:hypothetical protein
MPDNPDPLYLRKVQQQNGMRPLRIPLYIPSYLFQTLSLSLNSIKANYCSMRKSFR